jgi:hypothetical protein
MTDLPDNSPDQPIAPTPRSETTTAPPTRPLPRRRPPGPSVGRRTVDIAATLVGWAAGVVALILALHILFVIFTTNGSNTIVSSVAHSSNWLAWQFKDVFLPSNHKVSVTVNYGLAAVVYLILGRIVVALLRRLPVR